MDQIALLAASATVVVGTLLSIVRFRHQAAPIGILTLHVTLGVVGLGLWTLYVFGSQRDDEVAAILSGITLLASAGAGGVLYFALRGRLDLDLEVKPQRSGGARVMVLLHGLLAAGAVALVAIEASQAWLDSRAVGPNLDVEGVLPSPALALAWVAAGVITSLLGQLYAKKVNPRASMVAATLLGALGGILGGIAASLAPSLPDLLTVVAAALGGVFAWWFRMIGFSGFQDEPGGHDGENTA
jgi:hypothetical protein